MASLNKVMIMGNLGSDPESKFLPNGTAVSRFRVATSERYKDKDGQQQERTEWHRVSLFGRLAEIADEFLKKGDPIYVEGSIRTTKWQGQDGQDRYTTEIVGRQMQLLSKRSGDSPKRVEANEINDDVAF